MEKGKNVFECVVIGAGASGMMAAISAARASGRVLLVEHEKKVGKKLLATGNGKCNFTNAYMDKSCYRGDSSLLPILDRFTKEDTLSFFHEIGVYPKEKKGYYYPNSEQAASVVHALEKELERLQVEMLPETEIADLAEEKNGFLLHAKENTFHAKSLIFAVGLLASPKLGSDGSAFGLIKKFGHHFTGIVPALCGFYVKDMDFKKVAGVRCDAEITIYIEKEAVSRDTGELQLTEYGVSGIPVFQVSRFASMGLAQKKQVTASIRFLPELSEEDIQKEFAYRIGRRSGAAFAGELLEGLVNQKLIPFLLQYVGIKEQTRMDTAEKARGLITALTDFRIVLDRPREYEFAQVCAGGLDTKDIDTQTLMSKHVPGLFFCGEILDVDGICGGYNLQWAWSSGYVAGKNAANFALEGNL